MFADALVFCAHFGLARILLSCEQSNMASRKVIEVNGGQPDGELRYWIPTAVNC
jgi:predicted acetyltransferase